MVKCHRPSRWCVVASYWAPGNNGIGARLMLIGYSVPFLSSVISMCVGLHTHKTEQIDGSFAHIFFVNTLNLHIRNSLAGGTGPTCHISPHLRVESEGGHPSRMLLYPHTLGLSLRAVSKYSRTTYAFWIDALVPS
jgi:hypothetical protein